MSELRSLERIDETARLITNLEREGVLDRELEYLPDDVEIEERRKRKQGFTRPELAVVLSYAKIDLYNGLIESDATLEDFLRADPLRYFPELLRERYAELIPGHRLSRQILATLIANGIVNRMGPAFVKRIQMDTGADVATIARAYVVARQLIRGGDLLRTIEGYDHEMPASAQMSMMFEVSRTLRHICYWLIERFDGNLEIDAAVERLKERMQTMYTRTSSIISTAARRRQQAALKSYIGMGVPDKLAQRMSGLPLTRAALDIADLSAEYKRDLLEVARLYSTFNENLGLYWFHDSVEDLAVHGRWQSMARSHLREEFYRIRRELAAELLKSRSRRDIRQRVEEWLAQRGDNVERFQVTISEMKLRGEIDFATLTVAARELRELMAT
jgi:glutamate dehydrogenase